MYTKSRVQTACPKYVFSFHFGYNTGDGLSQNNGKDFTTQDRDNDKGNDGNCAVRFSNSDCGTNCFNNGAWWYNKPPKCSRVHINSPYGSSCFRWVGLPGIGCYIKYTEMKVRPN